MEQAQAARATTLIAGYFNGNKYDLNFNSAALGINVTLRKGAFLKNRQDQRINDPRLEEYVTAGLLSKELNPTPVPVVELVLPTPPPPPTVDRGKPGIGVFSVRADYNPVILPPAVRRQNVVTAAEPGIPPQEVLERVAKEGQVSVAAAGSVRVYTVAKAKKEGIISSGRGLAPGNRNEQPAKPANTEPKFPASKLGTAPVIPAPASAPIPPEALAEPQVPEAISESAPPAPISNRFVCKVDNIGFTYRSELKKYVSRKYPDKLKELVDDPYPLPKRTAIPLPESTT